MKPGVAKGFMSVLIIYAFIGLVCLVIGYLLNEPEDANAFIAQQLEQYESPHKARCEQTDWLCLVAWAEEEA